MLRSIPNAIGLVTDRYVSRRSSDRSVPPSARQLLCAWWSWPFISLVVLALAAAAPPLAALPPMPVGADTTQADTSHSAAAPPGAYDVTVARLIGEMTDVSRFLTPPSPSYRARLASSRDRSSEANYTFYNNDYGYFLRVESQGERREWVMMESYHPGAILKIWTPNPIGTLRIYLDDSLAPAIEAPMVDLMSGRVPPFDSSIAYHINGGYNFYFPLSYARFCRVTVDDGRDLFYQINYREYPDSARVEPFMAPDPITIAGALLATRRRFDDPSTLYGHQRGEVIQEAVSVGPGAPARIVARAPAGGGLVCWTRVAPMIPGAATESVRIRIVADTTQTVEGPLRAFFGGSDASVPFRTLVGEMDSAGALTSRWPMPFRDSLVVELSGAAGTFDASVGLEIQPYLFEPGRTRYLHATWHSEEDMITRPFRLWTMTDLIGEGTYVGTVLTVANPINEWWGEGDDRMIVDGRAPTDYWGTGTEDLFGGGWALFDRFSRPYHAFTETGPRRQNFGIWYGFWSMCRWYLLEPIPFDERLIFDLEVYHMTGRAEVSYGAMNFWYAPASTWERTEMASRENIVRLPAIHESDSIPGAIEGEWMAVRYFAGTWFDILPRAPEVGADWSRAQCFLWKSAPGPVGNRVGLGFRVATSGTYRVTGYFARGPGYGTFNIDINGRGAPAGIDLAADTLGATGPVDLGIFPLIAGENLMTVRVPDSATLADPILFGLDAIVLTALSAVRPDDAGDDADGPFAALVDGGRVAIRLDRRERVAVDVVDLLGNVTPMLAPSVFEAGRWTVDLDPERLPRSIGFLRVRAGDRVAAMPITRP